MELPESPPHRRQEKLSSAELERWLQSIYLRYNPSLLPQARIPEQNLKWKTLQLSFITFFLILVNTVTMCLRRSRNSSRSTKTPSHCSLRAFVENTEFHHRADGTKPADKYCDQPLLTGLSSLWRWLTRCPVGVQSVSSRCPVVSKSKSQTGDLFDLYSLYTILYLVPMVLILTCKHGRGCYTFWQAPVLGPFDMLVISHSEYIVAFRPAEKVLLLHEICYRLELYTSKWNERTRPLKSKEYVFSFKTRKVKTTLKERHKIPIRIRLWIGFAFLEKANTAIWYNLARCASHTSELCTLISS